MDILINAVATLSGEFILTNRYKRAWDEPTNYMASVVPCFYYRSH